MMLASSDEDDDEDEGEYTESPQQEYFASILAAARGVSEGTEKVCVLRASLSCFPSVSRLFFFFSSFPPLFSSSFFLAHFSYLS